MIREERDAAWWQAVAEHPAVAPHVFADEPVSLAEAIANPRLIPLAARHGGFLFSPLDALGRAYELHTLFTPEGWGREVLRAAKDALEHMGRRGADLMLTFEVDGNWRSAPPRSFGWKIAGDFSPSPLGSIRSWALLMRDWRASPAYRRMVRCP